MRVRVVVVESDPRPLVAAGIHDPLVGGFLDAGTYATVACACDALAAAVAGVDGLDLQRVESFAAFDAAPLHAALAAGDAVSLVVGLPGVSRAAWIICGYALPSMGPLRDCTAEDVVGTWRRLAGADAVAGRFLLEEPSDHFDPAVERSLTSRLRELYGE